MKYLRESFVTNLKFKNIFFIFLFMCGYFILDNLNRPIQYIYGHVNVSDTCVIPDPNPFDDEVMKYVFMPDPIQCSPDIDLVHFAFDGMLTINKSAASSFHNLNCSYKIVNRVGDYDIRYEKPVQLDKNVYIPADLCHVICSNNQRTIWERHLNNIDYRKVFSERLILNDSSSHLNVLVLGLDSVSRLAAIRHLPKTMNYLQKDLGAVLFKGHTVLGENTFENMIPFLTGNLTHELNINLKTETFDNFPVIWKDFQRNGYATYFAEDFLKFNMFNYYGKGFQEKPVDHYLRPFYLSLDKQHRVKNYLKIVQMKAEAMNIKMGTNSVFCYQNKARHKVMLDHIRHFFESYKGKRKFAMGYMTEAAHEVPSFLSIMDEDLYQFFKWLNDSDYLANTVVFFIGDHGARIDGVRNTVVGRIEVVMPLLGIYLPKHIRDSHPMLFQNFLNNAKILTTHTDSYQTMKDIIHQKFQPSKNTVFDSSKSNGISLFRKINPLRSCANIKIQSRICPCYTSKALNVSDPLVIQAANFILSELNNMLAAFSSICHVFSTQSVKSAEEIKSGIKQKRVKSFRLKDFFASKKKKCQKLRVLIRVDIKDALFEAMINFCPDGLQLIGKITRNNKYGNQSECLSEKKLKPYCICKQLADT